MRIFIGIVIRTEKIGFQWRTFIVELIKKSIADKEEVKQFFFDVFTKEPWNDDWSNAQQLDSYIVDLIGNQNSLTLAFCDKDNMVALAMGHIKHWYSATEYYIDELCVKTEFQGQGVGGQFVAAIEDYLKQHDIKAIFLLTDRDVPAYDFYRKHGFEEHKSNVAFAKNL